MYGSPRPVRTMTARIQLHLLTVGARLRQILPAARAAMLPLASAALCAAPAVAAHRVPAHAASHSAALHAASTARKTISTRALPTAHASAKTRTVQRLASNAGTRHTGRERAQAVTIRRAGTLAKFTPNTAALAALQHRATRYTSAQTAARGTAQASATRLEPSLTHRSAASVPNTPTDTAADRVHAWYRANAPLSDTANGNAPADPVRPVANPTDPSANTAVQQARQTTEADDKAAAQSHSPSTAPTEREPAPFTHGSFDDATQNPTLPTGHAQTAAPMDGGATLVSSRTPVTLAAIVPSVRLTPAPGAVHTLLENDRLSPTAPASPNNLFDTQGRLVPIAAMKGSHEILVHQNQMAVTDGLDRIQNDRDLLNLRQRKLLVALPDETSTYPDDRLPLNRRYARPWTVQFLRDLARAHHTRFGTPLIVTSAARTVEFQRRLVRTNGNAAPPTGDIASPHLYGQAIDIGKRGMGLTELTWMRAYLTPVENDGKIDVEEEFQQSCFHISVYRRYLGLPTPQTAPQPQLLTAKATPAPEPPKPEKKRRRLSTAMLAVGLR